MEASKVSIAQETFSKLHRMGSISPKRKREIRIEGVKNLIRSKPNGHKFNMMDLMQAAGYRATETNTKPYWAGLSFINGLVKKGVIIKNDPRKNKSGWCVGEDIHVKQTTKTVERTYDELTAVKPIKTGEDVTQLKPKSKAGGARPGSGRKPGSTNKLAQLDDTETKYSFKFSVECKSESGEFGRKSVAEINMHDVTAKTMSHMLRQTLENMS